MQLDFAIEEIPRLKMGPQNPARKGVEMWTLSTGKSRDPARLFVSR